MRDQERSKEERVNAYVSEAEQLAGRAPARAWRRAGQAMALLGSTDQPNGVADLRDARPGAHDPPDDRGACS